jgi:hypothetical protein
VSFDSNNPNFDCCEMVNGFPPTSMDFNTVNFNSDIDYNLVMVETFIKITILNREYYKLASIITVRNFDYYDCYNCYTIGTIPVHFIKTRYYTMASYRVYCCNPIIGAHKLAVITKSHYCAI